MTSECGQPRCLVRGPKADDRREVLATMLKRTPRAIQSIEERRAVRVGHHHRVKHKSSLIDKDDVTLMGERFRAGHKPQVVRATEGNNDLELAARSSLGYYNSLRQDGIARTLTKDLGYAGQRGNAHPAHARNVPRLDAHEFSGDTAVAPTISESSERSH